MRTPRSLSSKSSNSLASLAELFESQAGEATRIAYLLVGDKQAAEDIVQDAFVRLGTRFYHLRHPDAFSAYLRKVVVSLANSHFRRRAIEKRVLNSLPELSVDTASSSHEAASHQRDFIRRALLRLSRRQRTAIVLRFYADLSEAQVADLMGCPRGTVKSLVSRGLATLRETEEVQKYEHR